MFHLNEYTLGQTRVRFLREGERGRVGLSLIPEAVVDRAVPRRGSLRGLPFIDAMPGNDPWPASVVDPLVQVKIAKEPYPGAFAQGHTLRNAPSIDQFSTVRQRVETFENCTRVVTEMSREDGCMLMHRLTQRPGQIALEMVSSFHNGSSHPITLEMVSSFSLSGISPFVGDDGAGRLRVHRFRSAWSAEGRLETRTIEELHLERSWSGAGAFSERFGQVGSMPVRRWFPFVAIEDVVTGVVWGAQLSWAGSWQMEVYRQHDDVCLSGGLADREFGHWMKTLQPGETLTAPPAVVACVQGNLDTLCDALTAAQEEAVTSHPEVEQNLPIVFNEWCTTWGDPSHDKITAIAKKLEGSEIKYLVIDAGWYKTERGDWGNGHGDWRPSPELFPRGLEATAAAIRARGLLPGLWFEMETVGEASEAFKRTDLLLKRDGVPITVRSRRFWDLNNPAAIEYLSERVIELLRRGDFAYLKVDYNETIGLGSEDPDSLGEGLRKQVEGIYGFFDLIRAELPNLVIENCSSGGHRLEPSMLARTALSSFSDAHELVEIPIIAANLHRLILPRQSQIWAVLHRSDTDQRLVYSLAATFLGRMCLSGEITELTDSQWTLTRRAMQLYEEASPVIKHGRSRRFGEMGSSWRYPKGWQAVVRTALDGRRLLIVLHSFAEAPGTADIPLPPEQTWGVTEVFGTAAATAARMGSGGIVLATGGDFAASVLLLDARE